MLELALGDDSDVEERFNRLNDSKLTEEQSIEGPQAVTKKTVYKRLKDCIQELDRLEENGQFGIFTDSWKEECKKAKETCRNLYQEKLKPLEKFYKEIKAAPKKDPRVHYAYKQLRCIFDEIKQDFLKPASELKRLEQQREKVMGMLWEKFPRMLQYLDSQVALEKSITDMEKGLEGFKKQLEMIKSNPQDLKAIKAEAIPIMKGAEEYLGNYAKKNSDHFEAMLNAIDEYDPKHDKWAPGFWKHAFEEYQKGITHTQDKIQRCLEGQDSFEDRLQTPEQRRSLVNLGYDHKGRGSKTGSNTSENQKLFEKRREGYNKELKNGLIGEIRVVVDWMQKTFLAHLEREVREMPQK